MLKKHFATLVLICALGLTNLAYAEHSNNDSYEAMCQSTGIYSDTKLPEHNLAKNKGYRVMQLFGACGEKPNLLVVDNATLLQGQTKEIVRHTVDIWESPKKDGAYWKIIYSRCYEVASQGTEVNTYRQEPDQTQFIEVVIPQISQMSIKRFCSAKVGSPIFPHAQGDISCQRGAGEDNYLEKGYFDYLKDNKK